MNFSEAIILVAGRLFLDGRTTYRCMRDELGIDSATLKDVCDELIFRRLAVDENGQGLAAIRESSVSSGLSHPTNIEIQSAGAASEPIPAPGQNLGFEASVMPD